MYSIGGGGIYTDIFVNVLSGRSAFLSFLIQILKGPHLVAGASVLGAL